MLKTVAKAGIPIIAVTTSDVMNASSVLAHIVDSPVAEWPQGGSSAVDKGNLKFAKFFYTKDTALDLSEHTYDWLVKHGKVLFLLNHEGSSLAFDGGELPTPSALVQSFLSTIMSGDEATKCLPALQGLTLKGVSELVRITSVGGTITNHTLLENRWMVSSQVQGLEEVNKDLGVYLPCKQLVDYATLNLKYLNKNVPTQLRPRGVLLAGESGVGKTMGAKYLANQFDCPLYRLDISASLGRYVGQSEQALNKVLSSVQTRGTCVLLIDEVEKLFGETDDTGVTHRLLAQLLWFLQEHREPVLTVMTANNFSKLPVELYRPGRIDEVIVIHTLSMEAAIELSKRLYISIKASKAHYDKFCSSFLSLLAGLSSADLTPAKVTAHVYQYIKTNNLLTN